MQTTEPLSNVPEWSVSGLSMALRRTVEDAYGHVRVRGEISGYRGQHGSGHAYFALKDADAKIEAVIWKGVFGKLRFKPEEGMEVIATGKLTTFAGKSSYQIVIENLEPAGAGALMLLLEERRKKLEAEGLFAPQRKRPLPLLPVVVGVITSPTGAVIRDILHRIEDRFPRRVLLAPVRVQGETSAAEVAAAITAMNNLPEGVPKPDVLIVARGGGSLEDLWSFNEEAVVRAAAASAIPLISAIGHETDWTLLDLVADVRAPTPTAAAEMAVPVRSELLATLANLHHRSGQALRRGLSDRRLKLRAAFSALPKPLDEIARRSQRLDLTMAALQRGQAKRLKIEADKLVRLSARLARMEPRAALARARTRLEGLQQRQHQALLVRPRECRRALSALATRHHAMLVLRHMREKGEKIQALSARASVAASRVITARREALNARWRLFEGLSHKAVLARGYAIIHLQNGKAVKSISHLENGMLVSLHLHDGSRDAKITSDSRDDMLQKHAAHMRDNNSLKSPSRKEHSEKNAAKMQNSLFDDENGN